MKTVLRLFLIVFACAISGFAFSGELDDADALYDQGKFREALSIYMKHTDKPAVQNRIGSIYLKSGMRDEKKSMEWFTRAYKNGDVDAISNLALAYYKGRGVPKDYAKAFQLYSSAAAKSDAKAMNSLGYMYEKGFGTKQNEREAADWYLKAANAGSTYGQCNVAGVFMYSKVVKRNYTKAHEVLDMCLEAQPDNDCCLMRLSELYSGGLGVDRDAKKAHALRQQAAVHNHGVTLYMLGRDYDYGIGVEKDPKVAMDWYHKAAEKDHAKAMYRLYEVYEYGKLGQSVDKAKAKEWKARAEKAMKDQGLSRDESVDDFRLKMEEENK